MGIFPKRSPPKFKLFNPLSRTHEIFKVTEHEDNIWQNLGVPKWGISLKRGHRNLKQRGVAKNGGTRGGFCGVTLYDVTTFMKIMSTSRWRTKKKVFAEN